MKTETLMLIGLGGAAAYALLKPNRMTAAVTEVERPDQVAPDHGDAFDACETGALTNDDAVKIHETVVAALPLFEEKWDSAADAKRQAHRVAIYVMSALCPSWPRPKAHHLVPNYIEAYGPAWEQLYNSAHTGAFNLITGA